MTPPPPPPPPPQASGQERRKGAKPAGEQQQQHQTDKQQALALHKAALKEKAEALRKEVRKIKMLKSGNDSFSHRELCSVAFEVICELALIAREVSLV